MLRIGDRATRRSQWGLHPGWRPFLPPEESPGQSHPQQQLKVAPRQSPGPPDGGKSQIGRLESHSALEPHRWVQTQRCAGPPVGQHSHESEPVQEPLTIPPQIGPAPADPPPEDGLPAVPPEPPRVEVPPSLVRLPPESPPDGGSGPLHAPEAADPATAAARHPKDASFRHGTSWLVVRVSSRIGLALALSGEAG